MAGVYRFANNQDALKLEYLQGLVRRLLDDLPVKRDWLDPELEQVLREAAQSCPIRVK